jgi:hypothetical protein
MGTLCNCLTPPQDENIITFQPNIINPKEIYPPDLIASSRKTAPIIPHLTSIPFKKNFQEDQIETSIHPKTSRNNSDQNYFKYSSTFATSANFKEDEIISSSMSKLFSNRNSQSLDHCINNRLVIQITNTMNQIKQDLFINSNEILLTTDILNEKVDEFDIVYDSLLYAFNYEHNVKKVVYIVLYKHYFGILYDPQNAFSYEQIEKIALNDIVSVKNWYRYNNNKQQQLCNNNIKEYWFVIVTKHKEFVFGSDNKYEAKKVVKVLNFIIQNVSSYQSNQQ